MKTMPFALVEQLKAVGFSANDISVLFPDKTGTKDFAHEHHTKAPEGAAAGAARGGSSEVPWAGWSGLAPGHSRLGTVYRGGPDHGGPQRGGRQGRALGALPGP